MTILDAFMIMLTVKGMMSFNAVLILIPIEFAERKRLQRENLKKRRKAAAVKELQDHIRISDNMSADRQSYKNSLHQTVIVKGALAEEYLKEVNSCDNI